MLLRILRIAAVTIGFVVIFTLSRQATAARGGEDLPGISWTLGVLSLIFCAGAIASQRTRGPEANMQTDLLWGLAGGGLLTILSRC